MTPLKPGERSCIGWGPPSTPKRNSVVCAPPKGSALDIAPELLGDDNVDNLVTLLQVCGPMWLAASQRLIDVKSPQDTVTELVRLATRQSWLGEVYDLGQAALRQPAEYRLTSPEGGRRVFDAFLQLASRRAKSLATASLLPPWNLVGILSPGPTVVQRTLEQAKRQWEALTTAEQCRKNGTRTSGWTDLPCTTHPVSRLMYQLLHEGQFESDNAFFVEAVDLIQRIATGLLDTKLVENGHQKAKTDKRKGAQKTHCTLEHLQRVLLCTPVSCWNVAATRSKLSRRNSFSASAGEWTFAVVTMTAWTRGRSSFRRSTWASCRRKPAFPRRLRNPFGATRRPDATSPTFTSRGDWTGLCLPSCSQRGTWCSFR